MKTLVHAVGLVGCVRQFPTTDEAIAEAPQMIRDYLGFLGRHGAPGDPAAAFTTSVAGEDLSGGFLGTGPLASDARPISARESKDLLDRYRWMREDTLALVESMHPDALEAKPPKGRPLGRILSHMVGSDYAYVTGAGFRIPGLHALYNAADRQQADARAIARQAFDLIAERLKVMSREERERHIVRSRGTVTVRWMYRRLLEHNWEHYQEMVERVGPAGRVAGRTR